ncbi:radical SAM family heme chaperone HemW [Lutibacter sp. HS1-25]|uniref:radical SAM family heme chaperone HemW n=1 Tax=Lutibacter sp. HS1-25 TaxID=2485000 RepID=UPI0010133BAE|nr:radical SAM family heme chaperone HemW [Lutibacter sp. HS1-25]RXP45163.1 radical SAM family heme chaperone HemW [Lutibacter sp. HS1-25]
MAGIYIHIPFCKQACYYCDFHFSTSLKHKEALLNAIVNELILRKSEFKQQKIETIYFGGGTPSLLTVIEIQTLLNTVYQNYTVVSNPEITLEANPDDLSEEKIIELSKTPINRLSIGIQSFFEDDLKFMNRAHSAEESKKCLTVATQYFDNITIDLIYGVPNMSSEKWKKNLQIAFEFGVPHISSYALTVEEKTALANFIKKGKLPAVDEELALAHFEILVAETEKQGFVQYEISNFGKPAYFSKHNMSYWLGKKYLGVGPSAHSFNGDKRSWNISNNTKYTKSITEKILPNTVETLSVENRFNEYIMTGLRTIWGVSLAKIEREFDVEILRQFIKNTNPFIKKGLLKIEENTSEKFLITTKKGKFLADGIASDLFII